MKEKSLSSMIKRLIVLLIMQTILQKIILRSMMNCKNPWKNIIKLFLITTLKKISWYLYKERL